MSYEKACLRADEVVRKAKLAAKKEACIITPTDEMNFTLGWLQATLIQEYQNK